MKYEDNQADVMYADKICPNEIVHISRRHSVAHFSENQTLRREPPDKWIQQTQT